MRAPQRTQWVGARRRRPGATRRATARRAARAWPAPGNIAEQVRIVIEGVTPQVDGGRFAVKAVAGDTVEVSADIWKDGHELLRAAVIWRKLDPAALRARHVPPPPDLAEPGWSEA